MQNQAYRFCVAPMMDWTDRHCRFFHRLLSRRARLYTEMVTAAAVLHGDRRRFLQFNEEEHPVCLQLGGCCSAQLAEAAAIGADYGYDEINLNLGCPSERVGNSGFGAFLMREPELAGECVAAIRARVKIPVTVKCRTGVDDQDPETALQVLAERVIAAGCCALIVHARKAWLKGLSPKENREVPPLDYERVRRLKQSYPGIVVVLNGGLSTLSGMQAELEYVDGVMIGRLAYQNPALLLDADPIFFGERSRFATRESAIQAFIPYLEERLAEGVPLHAMTRHIFGLVNGLPGARAFRCHLAEQARKPGAGADVLCGALRHVERASAKAHEPSM